MKETPKPYYIDSTFSATADVMDSLSSFSFSARALATALA